MIFLTSKAPEILMSSRYCELADIYSLGLLFIEIYIEKNPFHKVEINFLFHVLENFKNKTMIPSFPDPEKDKCPHLMLSIIKQMVSYEPKERPSASIVSQNLNEKRIYIQLEEIMKKK